MENKTQKKMKEMEEIINKYENLIERIENENLMLVDCKYTHNGVEFDFILSKR